MPAEVRPLSREDIPAVADLFIRVFRKGSPPAPESLKSYLLELYVDNPWTGRDCPSLVYRDEHDRVRGFVGVIPLPLKIGSRTITASVAGNHMVDPDLKDPFAGVLLLRRLFASNPLLTISDSANEISRTLWPRLGGIVLTLFSMRWLRILRPSGYTLSLVPEKGGLSWLKPLLRPSCAAADLVASQLFSPFRDPGDILTAREPDIDNLQTAFASVIGTRALLPDYTKDQLAWRIAMAAKKEQYGPLHKVIVEDASGAIVGWYLYYPNPGDVARVIQIVARKNREGAVLNHLFLNAKSRRCVAVMGAIDPATVKEFSENQCLFFVRNTYMVAYSQDQEILGALLRGDAYLSRLEGEWWTRLQGDRF